MIGKRALSLLAIELITSILLISLAISTYVNSGGDAFISLFPLVGGIVVGDFLNRHKKRILWEPAIAIVIIILSTNHIFGGIVPDAWSNLPMPALQIIAFLTFLFIPLCGGVLIMDSLYRIRRHSEKDM